LASEINDVTACQFPIDKHLVIAHRATQGNIGRINGEGYKLLVRREGIQPLVGFPFFQVNRIFLGLCFCQRLGVGNFYWNKRLSDFPAACIHKKNTSIGCASSYRFSVG
jgi:hypothetical protein